MCKILDTLEEIDPQRHYDALRDNRTSNNNQQQDHRKQINWSSNRNMVNRIWSCDGFAKPYSEASNFLASLLNYKLKQYIVIYLRDVLCCTTKAYNETREDGGINGLTPSEMFLQRLITSTIRTRTRSKV